MITGIYALLNFVTNKIYIGQAVLIHKRWKNHRIALSCNTHTNRYLQSAYNKDGQFAFIYYVLEECSIEDLDKREQYWMDFYKSYDRELGYNLNPTAANSALGYKHSPETIEAWSKQRTGKIRGPEARAAIKAGWEKRKANGPVSEETKRKSSESHKGQLKSEEFKEGARQRMMGNTHRLGKLTGKRSPEVIANVIEGKRLAAKRREKDLMWTG